MARVRIENVSKIFRGANSRQVVAVNNASLSVEDKELLILVGPSGCGKTTTLRLIAGLEEVTHGTILINEQVVNELPPKDRDVAMIFQNDALYPHLTAFENMAFGLKLRKLPKAAIDQRVRETAAMLGLVPMLQSLPKELSGGERQRVALGRALVRKPKVLLLDEPLSNLDAPRRVQMRTEIAKLQTRLAATMIYVTHDQVEAMTLGDRIAVMKDGVIQQVDVPMNIYHHPANLFVAGFIGSPPMNFFHGVIVSAANKLSFREQNSRLATTGGFNVPLDDAMSSKLNRHLGKLIMLGIRPENIADIRDHAEATSKQTIEAAVELVEPMGSETYLHLTSGAHAFIARFKDSEAITLNQKVFLTFDMRKAHFFDPTTEQAII